jgi:lipid-A-disaccharide synthase
MSNARKIWIFAGESSGDAYGAELAKSLRELSRGRDELIIAGMGGSKMKSAGVEIYVDSSELGIVGFAEVIKKIFTFIKIFRGLVKRAEKEKPDAVVLIDYPGFNLRFAKEMWMRGIPVVWYVSPQVWAWGKKRIPKLAKYCGKMLVIFPFETETYAGTGLDTEFVGHPLVEIVRKRSGKDIKREENLVLLLPGSRGDEINRLLTPMLKTALKLHSMKLELKFAVSLNRKSIYERCLRIFNNFKRGTNAQIPQIEFYCGQTEILLQKACAGIAASGTVTVECAIAGLPIVVSYRLNPLSYFFGKMLVSLPYFTMVNIICGELVFREFLQDDVNPETLSNGLLEILPGGSRRAYAERKMAEMTNAISPSGERASEKAATAIFALMGYEKELICSSGRRTNL